MQRIAIPCRFWYTIRMVYVISDIHGEYDLFVSLLKKIKFSQNDVMYICGDMVDKGQDSVKLLRFIKSMPNFRCIVGNHEYAFLKRYWAMMENSPKDFDLLLKQLQAYFPHDGALLDWETVDWLETLPYYIEEKEFICVHAGVALTPEGRLLPLERNENEFLVNDRNFKEPSVVPQTEKCIFFGHTPTSYLSDESKIIRYKRENALNGIRGYYKIHLDLGVWLHGVLGCFCVDTCEEFYVDRWE